MLGNIFQVGRSSAPGSALTGQRLPTSSWLASVSQKTRRCLHKWGPLRLPHLRQGLSQPRLSRTACFRARTLSTSTQLSPPSQLFRLTAYPIDPRDIASERFQQKTRFPVDAML
jgi:hypothetical protein